MAVVLAGNKESKIKLLELVKRQSEIMLVSMDVKMVVLQLAKDKDQEVKVFAEAIVGLFRVQFGK